MKRKKTRTTKQKFGTHIAALRKMIDHHIEDEWVGSASNASLDRLSEHFSEALDLQNGEY